VYFQSLVDEKPRLEVVFEAAVAFACRFRSWLKDFEGLSSLSYS
jgi:hypothetical protein